MKTLKILMTVSIFAMISMNTFAQIAVINNEVVFTEDATMPNGDKIEKNMQQSLKAYSPHWFGVYNEIALKVMATDAPEKDKLTACGTLFRFLHFGRNSYGLDVMNSGHNPAIDVYVQLVPKEDQTKVRNILTTHENIQHNVRVGRDAWKYLDTYADVYGYTKKPLIADDLNGYMQVVWADMIGNDWAKVDFVNHPENIPFDEMSTNTEDDIGSLRGMLFPMSGALRTTYYTEPQIAKMTGPELVEANTELLNAITTRASNTKHTITKPMTVEEREIAERNRKHAISIEETGGY